MQSQSASESSARQSSTRLALLLFLFLSSVYALTSSGRVRTPDEYMAYFQTESLVLRHTLAVPQAVHFQNLYGKYDRFGQPRAPYPAGQALAASPFYAVGMVASAVLKPSPEAAMYLQQFFVTMLSAVTSAATVAVLYLLLINLGFSQRASLRTCLLIAFTTMLWPYAGYFFSEPLAGLLIVLAAFFLFAGSENAAEIPIKDAAMAGVMLGALVWVRFTHLVAAIVFCLAAVAAKKKLRAGALMAIIASVAVAGYLARNYHLYGNALQFGYPDFAEGGRRLNSFTTPAYLGLSGMLFSPGKSIFLFMPIIIPSLWGVRLLWRRSRGLAIVACALPAAYLLFFMTLTNWEGGRSPGPRYLLPVALLLCAAVAPLLENGSKRARRGVALAALAGLFVQVVSIATSFLEANVGHGYYDRFFNYRFSYCQLAVQLELLWRYAMGAPQQLGMGWDRWFVFLHYGGIGNGFIGVMLALQCAAVAAFGFLLRRDWRIIGASEQRKGTTD